MTAKPRELVIRSAVAGGQRPVFVGIPAMGWHIRLLSDRNRTGEFYRLATLKAVAQLGGAGYKPGRPGQFAGRQAAHRPGIAGYNPFELARQAGLSAG